MPRADTIGQQLAVARQKTGLSLEQVAATITEAGEHDERGKPLTVTSAALSRIERGDRLPSWRTLTALARVLAVTIVIHPDSTFNLIYIDKEETP